MFSEQVIKKPYQKEILKQFSIFKSNSQIDPKASHMGSTFTLVYPAENMGNLWPCLIMSYLKLHVFQSIQKQFK